MNTRKILFALMASFALLAASCTPNTAEDDLYDNGVDKTKIPSQKD
ncbi:hypothetical protein ACEZ3G_09760 [Maribacter algicola]|uniref:Uncharacterized protein n=1 Tax=Meishania litoralis TaxID=3434685 RepID=A0ACC7LL42_9FLAO